MYRRRPEGGGGGAGARIGAPPAYATGVLYITAISCRFTSSKTKEKQWKTLGCLLRS